jgi:hypothetical protein
MSEAKCDQGYAVRLELSPAVLKHGPGLARDAFALWPGVKRRRSERLQHHPELRGSQPKSFERSSCTDRRVRHFTVCRDDAQVR